MLENNKLPKDWKLVKISDVSDINPKLPNRDEIDREIEVQFLPMKLVEATINKIHLTETKKIIDVMKGSYTSFINNDIIFAKVTPCMENGKIAVVNNLKNGIGFGSSEFHVLRPKKEVLNKYLFHYIIQDSFRNKAANEMTGAVGLRRVPKKFIENSLIPIPPIKIQSSIVSKIEELFSELDKGIEDLNTAQKQLKIYRQSVLKWAFESIISKKQNFTKLKEITSKIGSGSTPKGGSDNYLDSGIPLVRSLNIHFDYIKYKNLAFIDIKQAEKLKNVIVNENDVLLNITGASIGRVNIAPKEFHNGRVNQHVSIIRPKNNSFLPKFLKYFLQTSEMQNWISNANYGVTRPALTKGMLENLEIPIPQIDEQQQIVHEIENQLSVADKMEETITQSLQKAEALRQSILKKSFSGELV